MSWYVSSEQEIEKKKQTKKHTLLSEILLPLLAIAFWENLKKNFPERRTETATEDNSP